MYHLFIYISSLVLRVNIFSGICIIQIYFIYEQFNVKAQQPLFEEGEGKEGEGAKSEEPWGRLSNSPGYFEL